MTESIKERLKEQDYDVNAVINQYMEYVELPAYQHRDQ